MCSLPQEMAAKRLHSRGSGMHRCLLSPPDRFSWPEHYMLFESISGFFGRYVSMALALCQDQLILQK